MLSAPPADKAPNQPIPTTQLGAAPAPNETMLSVPPADKAPNQPIPTTQLGAPAPNKTMLLVLLVDEMPNQPPLVVQLEIPALLQQDLARVSETLPASILPESLIIQNAVQKRPRKRGRGHPRCSRGQKQEDVDRGHSVGGGELIDWTVAANSMANALNQNR